MEIRPSDRRTPESGRARKVSAAAHIDRGGGVPQPGDRNALLYRLATSDAVARGEFDEAVHQITEVAAASLGVERVGIWLLVDEQTTLCCRDEYDAREGEHRSGARLDAAAVSTYLHETTRVRTVAVRDVRNDPRVAEFADFFRAHHVVAMLDAPVRVAGRMVGTVCHEYLDEPRDWTPDDEAFAASIADLVSIAYGACEHRRAERLQSAVYRIAQATDQAASLDELYPAVHAIVGEVLPAENFYIALLDESRTRLRYPYFVDQKDRLSATEFPIAGLTGWVLRAREAAIVDLERRTALVESGELVPRGTPALAWMGTPLRSGDETLGVMAVQSYRDVRAFGRGDLEVLNYVSTQVARAIERKQREQRLEARTRQQTALVALSQHAGVCRDQQALLDLAVQCVRRTLDLDFVHVLDLDPSLERFWIRAGAGWEEEEPGPVMIPAGKDSQAGYALAAGEPVVVADLAEETRFTPAEMYLNHGVTSSMTAILRDGEHAYGALVAMTRVRRHFVFEEVSFLQAVANILGATNQRHRAEAELRRERDRAVQVMQSLGQGVCLVSASGQLEYVNEAYERILGRPSAEILGMTAEDLVVPEDHERSQEARRARQAGLTTTYERRHRLPNGEMRTVLVTGTPRTVDGELQGSIAVVTDITDLKRVEEELERERDFAMQVMQTLGQGVSVVGADLRIEYVNAAYANILGVPADELVGRSARDRVLPEDLPAFERAIEDRFSGRSTTYELRHCRPDGEVCTVLVTGVPRYVEGRFAGAIAVITDITRFKRAEAALRDSEALFRAVSEQMPASLFLLDMDDPEVWGKIVHVNQAGLRMHGCTSEEVLGRSITQYLSESEEEENRARAVALMAGETLSFEATHRRQDGSEFPVGVAARMIEHGGRHLVLCMSQDITERRWHEHAMHRLVEGTSETGQRFFEALVRAMAEAFGTQHAIIAELLPDGKEVRTLAFWSDGRLVPNVEYALAGTACEVVLESGPCFYPQGVAGLFPHDAMLCQLQIEAYLVVPLEGVEGRPLGLMSVMQRQPMNMQHDFAALMKVFAARAAAELDRLRVQRTLQDSERRARAILEAIPDLVLRHASDGTLLEIKAGDPRDVYRSPTEILGRKMDEFMPPEIVAGGHDAFDQALRTGELQQFNYDLDMAHGQQHYEARIVPSGDELISFVRNVTAQRNATEELCRSRERLELALWGSGLGLWDWDLARDFVYYGKEWLGILGYVPDELVPTPQGWQELLHPEDRNRVLGELLEHFAGRSPFFDSEHRLRAKSGNWRWVLNRSKVWERAPDGSALRFTGTLQDISRQKRTASRLVALQAERRELERARRLQVVQAQENERAMLSRELHDGVGQLLTGLQLSLVAKDSGRRDLAEEIALARLAATTVGHLSRLMHPPELEISGVFDVVVQYLCHTADESRPEVTAALVGNEPVLDATAKGHLFRIAQEAVTNALKHGNPRRVELRFSWRPEQLMLTVADDGCGLGDSPRTGIGTRSLKDRAALLRGVITWGGNERGGTTVTLVVPMPAKA